MERRPRVVIALPDCVEAATVARWLEARGLDPVTRAEAGRDGYDLLIADAEVFSRDGLRRAGQAGDTRVPTILLGPAANEPRGVSVDGQPMYLARPLDRAMLACFAMMALLDRRPERRSLRKPVQHADAYVNGLPVRIVDVSNEGLCLVTPPDRSALLPPTFTVRVPLMGVSVAVQRVWGRRATPGASTTWYGGALAQNSRAAEQGWKTFVDMVPVAQSSQPPAPGA
jgi:hypothetical protein